MIQKEVDKFLKCDLHMHSTASDGTATPQQLVDEAVKKNIDIIALCGDKKPITSDKK